MDVLPMEVRLTLKRVR